MNYALKVSRNVFTAATLLVAAIMLVSAEMQEALSLVVMILFSITLLLNGIYFYILDGPKKGVFIGLIGVLLLIYTLVQI